MGDDGVKTPSEVHVANLANLVDDGSMLKRDSLKISKFLCDFLLFYILILEDFLSLEPSFLIFFKLFLTESFKSLELIRLLLDLLDDSGTSLEHNLGLRQQLCTP